MPAKFSSTVTPGLAFSNSSASSVKVALSDAAAKTVMEPSRADAAVVDVLVVAGRCGGRARAGGERDGGHAARARTPAERPRVRLRLLQSSFVRVRTLIRGPSRPGSR